MHNLCDGANVVLVRARGAVGANLHPALNNFAGQRLNVLDRALSGAGKTKIERVDAKRFHQMQDFDFLFNRRIANRGRLQAITQGFVIQLDRARRQHFMR